jgi:hypothetical protein
MNSSILKNSLASITATVAAVSFGYFAAQYFGQSIMLAISTGMFGLGAAVQRTQQLPHQKSLPETLVITEPQAQLTQSDKQLENLHDYSTSKNTAKTKLRSVTTASRFVRTQEKSPKFASKSQSSGYCRKRLALCHKAKIENLTKAIPKDRNT